MTEGLYRVIDDRDAEIARLRKMLPIMPYEFMEPVYGYTTNHKGKRVLEVCRLEPKKVK